MSDRTTLPATTRAIIPTVFPHAPLSTENADLRRLTASQATSTSHHCPFLDLPTEMRLEIYELALLDAPSAVLSIQLLQTCRHISMEARPTLYKRPTSFASQAKLFAWIERSQQKDLRRVRTLTLRLMDIDLSPLLDQSSSPGGKSRTSVWALYQTELERLDDACKALPKLSSLTIVPPKNGRSQLLKGLYHSFLALIPNRLPKLKQLELQDGDEVLNTVPTLKGFAAVKCTGGSPASSSRKARDPMPEKQVNAADMGEMEEIVQELRDAPAPIDGRSAPRRAKVHKAISKRKSKQAMGDSEDHR